MSDMNHQENKSKGSGGLSRLFTTRKLRYGGFAVLLTVVAIVVVILLNIAVDAVVKNWALSVDLTAINVTDFDEETVRVASGVEEDVYVYTVFRDSTTSTARVQVEDVLNKYHALNNRIVLGNIDSVKEPARLNALAPDANLSEGAIIVTNADETRIKLINRADYVYTQTSSLTGQTYGVYDLEPKMTSAIMYVTSKSTPRVFYLSGHDELNANTYLTVLTRQLSNQNYDVASLNLTSDSDVTLQSGDTVVVVNPQRDLSDAEYETMRAWLAEGGRLLFAMDYQTDISVLTNFTKLLDYYQMSFGEGVVMENANATANWNGDVYTLVPNLDAENTVTKPLSESGAYLMLPSSRPVNPVNMPESGLQFANLLTSSDRAVVMKGEEASDPGTQILAMTMLKSNSDDSNKDIRIALVGNLYSMVDTNLLNYSYNMSFTNNLFSWLVNRQEGSLNVIGKLLANTYMAIPDQSTAWTVLGVNLGVAVLVLLAGIVVWRRRRSL